MPLSSVMHELTARSSSPTTSNASASTSRALQQAPSFPGYARLPRPHQDAREFQFSPGLQKIPTTVLRRSAYGALPSNRVSGVECLEAWKNAIDAQAVRFACSAIRA